jgi:hypothetical protein
MSYSSYTPVDPDFYDTIQELTGRNLKFTVFFFLPDLEIGEVNGEYRRVEKKKDGEFLLTADEQPVRIDRIITINGKPGPAYYEYNAYADACLSCQAGYDNTDKQEKDTSDSVD